MNNYHNAEHAENGYDLDFSEQVSLDVPRKEVGTASDVRQAPYTKEALGYRATCEESYDIMAQTIAIYANSPNALYTI